MSYASEPGSERRHATQVTRVEIKAAGDDVARTAALLERVVTADAAANLGLDLAEAVYALRGDGRWEGRRLFLPPDDDHIAF
jgi:hypothetical protein